MIEEGKLRKVLPESVVIAEEEDQLSILLDRYDFTITKGHLDQAISAHTRGEWAGANAQLRSFVESLFDSFVTVLVKDTSNLPPTSYARRELLTKLDPPFILPELNEWAPNGTGFLQGFWKRLHPQGAHPGLSDEEDCTFRLQLVILVAGHYLRRFVSNA